jgi:hypothetical protein
VAVVDSREEGGAIEAGLAADRGEIVDGDDVFLSDSAALQYADSDVWRGKEREGGRVSGEESRKEGEIIISYERQGRDLISNEWRGEQEGGGDYHIM